jgi:hypothetical protein
MGGRGWAEAQTTERRESIHGIAASAQTAKTVVEAHIHQWLLSNDRHNVGLCVLGCECTGTENTRDTSHVWGPSGVSATHKGGFESLVRHLRLGLVRVGTVVDELARSRPIHVCEIIISR